MSARREDYWERVDAGDDDDRDDGDGDADGLEADAGDGAKTRVGMWMEDDCDVYAGRGAGGDAHLLTTEPGERGWLGNPYTLEEFDRDEAIAAYARAVLDRCDDDPAFRDALGALQGEGVVLGCWCRRLDEDEPACHCDVLVRVIDDALVAVDADGGERR